MHESFYVEGKRAWEADDRLLPASLSLLDRCSSFLAILAIASFVTCFCFCCCCNRPFECQSSEGSKRFSDTSHTLAGDNDLRLASQDGEQVVSD